MHQVKISTEQYYYNILNLYKESKLMQAKEIKQQQIEQILGHKITPYTVTQLEQVFKKD